MGTLIKQNKMSKVLELDHLFLHKSFRASNDQQAPHILNLSSNSLELHTSNYCLDRNFIPRTITFVTIIVLKVHIITIHRRAAIR